MRDEFRFEHTRGRAECPNCHDKRSHEIWSTTADGWPSKVRCPTCGKFWTYYSPGTLAKRKTEQSRRQSHEWYDRESLEVAIMHAKVRLKQSRLLRENHTCKACGRTFTARYPSQVNCDECISSGRIRHGVRPRMYDYDRIRELSAQGMTAVEVAEEVGCSRVTFLNALKAKR